MVAMYGKVKQTWPRDEVQKQTLAVIESTIELIELRIVAAKKELH